MPEDSSATHQSQTESNQSNAPKPSYVSCLALAAIGNDLFHNREKLFVLPAQGVIVGRGEGDALFEVSKGNFELRIQDSRLSVQHVRLVPSGDAVEVIDLNSTNGTRLNGQKITRSFLRSGDILEIGRCFFVYTFSEMDEEISKAISASNSFLGPTPSVDPRIISEVLKARLVAPSQVSVLITGESGTGKEILARQIHTNSQRRGRMVAVHCGAIPEGLLESELFGHKKGAFTGATSSTEGLILTADGGTLFLDEIGEMPASAQVRLLRVLQEKEVTPVGDVTPRKVDIRLVAATHRDLREMALSGKFRGDLYARLEGISLYLPKLSQRKSDLGIFIAHFLQKFAGERAVLCTPSQTALRLLFLYSWPFNIRELEKVMETAVVLCGASAPIEPKHLPASLQQEPPRTPSTPIPIAEDPIPSAQKKKLSATEEEQFKANLIEALERNKGSISAVAREWGKARMQIQRWVKRYGLQATPEEE